MLSIRINNKFNNKINPSYKTNNNNNNRQGIKYKTNNNNNNPTNNNRINNNNKHNLKILIINNPTNNNKVATTIILIINQEVEVVEEEVMDLIEKNIKENNIMVDKIHNHNTLKSLKIYQDLIPINSLPLKRLKNKRNNKYSRNMNSYQKKKKLLLNLNIVLRI